MSSGNVLQYLGIYAKGDESTYWTGQIVSPRIKTLVAQGNFGVIRDLDLTSSNIANCTTWYTRKPAAYYTYLGPEMRASLAASAITYNSGTDTYSVALVLGIGAIKKPSSFNFLQPETPAARSVSTAIPLFPS